MPPSENLHIRILELTTEIVVAAVQTGTIHPATIPGLIASVFDAVISANAPSVPSKSTTPAILNPAVPIENSVMPDYIICLDDGKHFKSMRGHLRKLGMSPEQYREKWGLPSDYPIVAPNYAASRSALALKIGLGKAGYDTRSSGYTRKIPSAGA